MQPSRTGKDASEKAVQDAVHPPVADHENEYGNAASEYGVIGYAEDESAASEDAAGGGTNLSSCRLVTSCNPIIFI